jgi:nitrite reductase (NO-forming)
MYHCGTSPVLMHIGSGMHGAIIVSPREPLPPARDYVLVQTEFYLAPAANGVRAFDYQKMLSTLPDYLAFNGRPSQYVKEPIRVKVGERVRFWLVDAGRRTRVVSTSSANSSCGLSWRTSADSSRRADVQRAGGRWCGIQLVCDVAGEFPFVNHGFGHGQKGAIGTLVVEG